MKISIMNGVGLVTLKKKGRFVTITLGLMKELNSVLPILDRDKRVGAIVLTGSAESFAAGGDIQEMKDRKFP